MPEPTQYASENANDILRLTLGEMTEYEPPELNEERLKSLKARRQAFARSQIGSSTPAAAREMLREIVAIAANLPDVHITYDVSRRTWRLLEDYSLPEREGYVLTAKRGYSFDLSSIPRPLWWLIAPNELSIVAPLFHDLIYEHKGRLPEANVKPYRTFTRREADDLFFELMAAEGVSWWRRSSAYSAVRSFGWIYWD